MMTSGKVKSMKSLVPSITKWILNGVFVFTVLSCSSFVVAESVNQDIWTEDADSFTEDSWSDRRVEGFLNRLEEMDPQRARAADGAISGSERSPGGSRRDAGHVASGS